MTMNKELDRLTKEVDAMRAQLDFVIDYLQQARAMIDSVDAPRVNLAGLREPISQIIEISGLREKLQAGHVDMAWAARAERNRAWFERYR